MTWPHPYLRLLVATLALCVGTLCAPAASTRIISEVTITDGTVDGDTFTVNGSTRTFTNTVTSSPGTLIPTAATIDGARLALFTHLSAYPFPGSLYLTDVGTNGIRINGQPDANLVVSAVGAWATLALSTNVIATTNARTVRIPADMENIGERTNIWSEAARAIGLYSTNSIAANSFALLNFLSKSADQTVTGTINFSGPNIHSGAAWWGGTISNVVAHVVGGSISNVVGHTVTITNLIVPGTGVNSVKLGDGSEAGGTGAVALGDTAKANGLWGFAAGYLANAGTNTANTATGTGSIAGLLGDAATAGGSAAWALEDYSTAYGAGAKATNVQASAFGAGGLAYHQASTTLGYGAATTTSNQVRIGRAEDTASIAGTLWAAQQTNSTYRGTNTVTGDWAEPAVVISSLANGINFVTLPAEAVHVRFSGAITEDSSIASLTGGPGRDGRMIRLHNATGWTLTYLHESGTETATTNRIVTADSAGLTSISGSFALFIYDSTAGRWRPESVFPTNPADAVTATNAIAHIDGTGTNLQLRASGATVTPLRIHQPIGAVSNLVSVIDSNGVPLVSINSNGVVTVTSALLGASFSRWDDSTTGLFFWESEDFDLRADGTTYFYFDHSPNEVVITNANTFRVRSPMIAHDDITAIAEINAHLMRATNFYYPSGATNGWILTAFNTNGLVVWTDPETIGMSETEVNNAIAAAVIGKVDENDGVSTNLFLYGSPRMEIKTLADGVVSVDASTNQLWKVQLTQDTTLTFLNGSPEYVQGIAVTQDAEGGNTFSIAGIGRIYPVLTNAGYSTVVKVDFVNFLTNHNAELQTFIDHVPIEGEMLSWSEADLAMVLGPPPSGGGSIVDATNDTHTVLRSEINSVSNSLFSAIGGGLEVENTPIFGSSVIYDGTDAVWGSMTNGMQRLIDEKWMGMLVSGNSGWGAHNAGGGTTVISSTMNDHKHWGAARLITSATNHVTALALNPSSMQLGFETRITIGFLVKWNSNNTGTTRRISRIGLGDSTTEQNPVDGLYAQQDYTSEFWQLVAARNSVFTTNQSGSISAQSTQWSHGIIYVDASTNAFLYVNGVLAASLTDHTTLPTSFTGPWMQQVGTNFNTTDASMYVDDYTLDADFPARIP